MSVHVFKTPYKRVTLGARPKGFYVYLHRTSDTKTPFYVGLGQGRRAWNPHSRNQHWGRVALKHGVLVEVVRDRLTVKQAAKLEAKTIAKFGIENLTNYSIGGDCGRVGLLPANIRAVECSNGMTFVSANEAARWLRENTDKRRASGSSIIGCCKQHKKSAYGFDWRYAGDLRDFNYISREDRIGASNSKRVIRSDGVEFASGAAAGRFMHTAGLAPPTAWAVICGAAKHGHDAYGYSWEYVSEE